MLTKLHSLMLSFVPGPLGLCRVSYGTFVRTAAACVCCIPCENFLSRKLATPRLDSIHTLELH